MRLKGSYSIRTQSIHQRDYQIDPQHWKTVEGFKFPIRGPFTEVVCDRGCAVLYVSPPGEVPLFYSTTPGWIHWGEQRLELPGRGARRVQQGTAAIWTPQGTKTIAVDVLPYPEIVEGIALDEAIAQYQQRIIKAVHRRLSGRTRVAVSQSGGIDSLLITWALLHLGTEIVPITVCSTPDDLDIVAARAATAAMGLTCIPIVVEASQIEALLDEAVIAVEDSESLNARMAIANLLIARQCREMGIDLIFNGHGHDDIHGKGSLVKGALAQQQEGTLSQRWRDARWLGTEATSGMLKMFASTCRRYGVEVRMPFYDADLLEWAFSQPVEVIPADFKKSFARSVARATLPPGFWTEEKHSVGYLRGAGLSLKQDLLKDRKDLFIATSLGRRLKAMRGKPCDRTGT